VSGTWRAPRLDAPSRLLLLAGESTARRSVSRRGKSIAVHVHDDERVGVHLLGDQLMVPFANGEAAFSRRFRLDGLHPAGFARPSTTTPLLARNGHGACVARRPLSRAKPKTCTRNELFRF
jgi:hypothetical protein